MPHVPHQLSVSNLSPSFLGQGALSSNNQGQRRPPFFEENILYLLSDMKKTNDSWIASLETTQVNMGATLKNLETQMGQLAQSMKVSSTKSFSSDTKKNPKECMAITLRSGEEVEDGRRLENSKDAVNEKVEKEKMVNEEVANKRAKNENMEISEQGNQMGKKEDKREENYPTLRNVLLPRKPSLVVPPLSFP